MSEPNYVEYMSRLAIRQEVRIETEDGACDLDRAMLSCLKVGRKMVALSFFIDRNGEWGYRRFSTSTVCSIKALPDGQRGCWVTTKNSRYRLVWPPESVENPNPDANRS